MNINAPKEHRQSINPPQAEFDRLLTQISDRQQVYQLPVQPAANAFQSQERRVP